MPAPNRSLVARTVSAFLLLGCSTLTEPGPGAPPLQAQPAPAASAAPSAAPAPTPAPPPPTPAPEEQVGASHILIAYKGALRAADSITRSKDEAQKLAKTVQTKAKSGGDFAALARQYSDDPTAKAGGGSLGKFGRSQMVKPFADAAFALKPGEISQIVETGFGFHVIKRTE